MEYKLTFKDFNEALKGNKLLGLKCKECGTITVPPKMVCRKCASPDLEVVELKGTGKIQTLPPVMSPPKGVKTRFPILSCWLSLMKAPG
ncbi:hypothetical protein ES703_40213 [subsurface metagenome]